MTYCLDYLHSLAKTQIMCGIAGIFRLAGKIIPSDTQVVKRMMDAQIHRGPDDSGLYQDDHVVLGHRRLSIIDLSEAGRQPMSNEACPECTRRGGAIWLTYNGEIYNFRELRQSLIKAGHKFQSNSDTEVILHGYVQWGIAGLLERLRGMFAFALYDSGRFNSELRTHHSKLFLARDRFGIKPLYYYQHNELLIFSSEVKAIAKSGLVPVERKKEAEIAFLIFGNIPEPLTTIRNVFSLPAGNYMEVENGRTTFVQYYDLHDSFTKPKMKDVGNIYKTLPPILTEAVNMHLISDAPLGVFLSGGIDSSSLVALAGRDVENPLATLSIVFDEEGYSELPYQRMIARKYRTDHREIKITEKDFCDEIENIFKAMDQPTIDGVNTYFVSRAAKQAGLKAVLSGTGGDEVFCGYDSFKKMGFLRRIYGLPKVFKTPLALANHLKGRWNRIGYLQNTVPLGLYLTIRGLFIPKDVAGILDISEAEVKHVLESLTLCTRNSRLLTLEPIDCLSYMELSFYLKNQLLKDTDFMSMYHSVETRVPLLDHVLVDYVASVSGSMKTDKNMPKPLLIKTLNHLSDPIKAITRQPGDSVNLLPNEIIFRKKQGFTFPLDVWIRNRGRDLFEHAMSRNSKNEKYSASLWRNFQQNKVHWPKIWAPIVAAQFNEN